MGEYSKYVEHSNIKEYETNKKMWILWQVIRAKIGDVQKTAILLFAEYIDAATTIAVQSGGGGGGATSGWGCDKDEDELSWAYRCAMMANRLCRPRKKQGYGR